MASAIALQRFWQCGYGLLAASLIAACAQSQALKVQNDLPPQNPKGYLEFYCLNCVTGWTVYRIEDGREVYVGRMVLGQKTAATIRNPLRMKRLRLAHPPGTYQFLIRLLPGSYLDSDSGRIVVQVQEEQLTPVRLDFVPKTYRTYAWSARVGHIIPFQADPAALEILTADLYSPDWETRWLALEVLGQLAPEVAVSTLMRLNELSTDEAYLKCLRRETLTLCALSQRQARQTLKQYQDAPP